jgi:hypothetical protein
MQNQPFMQNEPTTEPQVTIEPEPPLVTQPVPTEEQRAPERTKGFARRHPALTVIGVAGAGLLGGIELAAGVLIGAGVAALVRARDGHAVEAKGHVVRDRASALFERAPDEMKKRARAVMQAARGKLEPS